MIDNINGIKVENGKLLLTKEVSTISDVGDYIDVEQVRLDLRIELSGIIRQVKSLKKRAFEIQDILRQLE